MHQKHKKHLFILVFYILFFSAIYFSVSAATTLYFNAAVDNNWNTLGNWWQNSSFTIPAASLPTIVDDVIITGNVSSNSGPMASVKTMTVNGTASFGGISITLTNGATFNNSSTNSGTINGNATFNDSSSSSFGSITGDVIFNDSSFISEGSGVGGNAIFNNLSSNRGTISGNATFNGSSYNKKAVIGNATFNDSSFNDSTCLGFCLVPTIGGNATFYGSSHNDGKVSGNAFFNDGSRNSASGIVSTNASFFDLTVNQGTVSGNACFAVTADPDGGTVGGVVTACSIVIPTVATTSSTVLSSSSADLFGSITNTGGESANTVGFQFYGQNTVNTTYSDTVSTTGTFTRQSFDKVISSLTACGLYHFRAFATNSAGTGYGSDLTLTANPCHSGGGGSTNPPTVPPPVVPPPIPPPVVSPPAPAPAPAPKPTPPPAPKPTPAPKQTPAPAPKPPTSTKPLSVPPKAEVSVSGNILKTVRGFTNNPKVKKVGNVTIAIPVAISLVALLASLLYGIPLLNYLFYLFVVFSQILGFRKKPTPWGTVYDSLTKRPLPFARVEILNEQSRKLESTITDSEGRYGFLISQNAPSVKLQAYMSKYDFPSKFEPSLIEQKLYPNIYRGGLISVSSGSTNLDLPMDPREKSLSPGFYFGITSTKLNDLLTSAANVLFVAGSVLGIANAIVNPSVTSYAILALVFITFILRTSGFKLKPFGLTKDLNTNTTLPFGLITLHNQAGERTSFTVSDGKGRYFLLTPKGNYLLKAFTPAHISPTRIKEVQISARKGWISREIGI